MVTRILLALILAASCHVAALGDLSLSSPLMTDGMVLQRGINIVISGKGTAGAELKLQFGNQTKTTLVGPDGDWTVAIEPLAASTKPAELTITADESSIVLRDVVVGDVWLCSGQSNMAYKLAQCSGGKEAAAAANDRLLRVNKSAVRSKWETCTEEAAASTSGVAFFFANKLRQQNPDVPVGLIIRALSGSPIEAWMPVQALNKIDFCRKSVVDFHGDSDAGKKMLAFQKAEAAWKRIRRKEGAESAGKKPRFDGTPEQQVLAGIYAEGQPGRLWEGRIKPVVGYRIKGAIWYQGERNTKAGSACAAEYENMLPAMITAWRDAWGQGEFRFLAVQLPPFVKGGPNWITVQKGQAVGVTKVKNADFIDTSDLPDGGLHPKDKRPIGERLATKATR